MQLDTLKLTGMLCLIEAHKFRLTPRIDALRRACLANPERAQAAQRESADITPRQASVASPFACQCSKLDVTQATTLHIYP